MIKADLHIHSKYSPDGEYEVADIVDMVAGAKVGVFTLSDHNSVSAICEAVVLAEERNIGFIPGIEIDCVFEGTDMHLLGYGINWESEDFISLEQDIRTKTLDSLSEMLYNLARLGIEVEADEVMRLADGRLPSGELIAEALLSNPEYDYPELEPYRQGGARADMPYLNFYFDYFAQGRPAYVAMDFMSFKAAVELVRDNGGTPVVAHPGLNFRGNERIVEKMLSAGAHGLEVFNNYHNDAQMDYFAGVVRNERVLMTCGSDFHGKTKPSISIGQYGNLAEYADYLNDSVMKLCSR